MAENEIEVLISLREQLLDKEENNYANQVLVQIKTSKAWLNYAQGNTSESLQIMREAAEMEDKTDFIRGCR